MWKKLRWEAQNQYGQLCGHQDFGSFYPES